MGSLWNRSGTIERYADDIRAAGAKAFFFQGGTTTGQTVYLDAGEGEAHPSPVLADARGRWPDVFIPYSATGYDVQVKTADDVQLTYTQSIPNPNPIAVSPPPATDGLQTGMIHGEFTNGTKAGFVRLNGKTIGNASSGATERANDVDTLALYTYLWNNVPDSICSVSGGRGGSAAADFSPGNKTLKLPDCRGTTLVGLDDMGSSAAARFTAQSFAAGSATTPGSGCGNNSRTLAVTNLPAHSHTASAAVAGAHNHGGSTGSESAHTHTGTTGAQSVDHTHSGTTSTDPGHTHTIANAAQFGSAANGGSGGNASNGVVITATGSAGAHNHTITTGGVSSGHVHNFTTAAGSAHLHSISTQPDHTHTITVDPVGSGTPLDNLGHSILVTWYIKL